MRASPDEEEEQSWRVGPSMLMRGVLVGWCRLRESNTRFFETCLGWEVRTTITTAIINHDAYALCRCRGHPQAWHSLTHLCWPALVCVASLHVCLCACRAC